jgi:pyruvate/2-oxoglutarate/acetoin dehydrogenase E1 component
VKNKKIFLKNVISKITKNHLKKFKSFVFGQNLLGVGQVNGTLPAELKEKDGIIDLPMADVAGGGIVTGCALQGLKPIYIIRYQGYNWFNMIFIVNYAAKAKSIWKIPCPIFIRGIANEGSIGPVAGSTQISQFYKMPGIKIFSPITPQEYKTTYNKFTRDTDVYYISEHRKTYENFSIVKSYLNKKTDLTVILNSITRHSANDIIKEFENTKFKISIIHLYKLKPLVFSKNEIRSIKNSKKGVLICDNDYLDGIPAIITSNINSKYKVKNIYSLGLKQKTAGHHPKQDVLPPDSKAIISKIYKILKSKKNL